MNYNILMEEEITKNKELGIKPKLLLHCCCGPCTTASLERLIEAFDVSLFYYNPNITLEDEYKKRLVTLEEFISKYNKSIKIIEGDYEPSKYLDMVKDYKLDKEGGQRCYLCYLMRLRKSAEYAFSNNFDYFTTTLSISPHKNSEWINKIGEELEKEIGIKYLYTDLKKKNGYKRSLELSKEFDLYRQDYCGCPYSKID